MDKAKNRLANSGKTRPTKSKPPFEAGPIDLRKSKRKRIRSANNKPRRPRPRKHACRYCQMKFYTPSFKDEHENSHTGKRPFECDKCHATFGRRSALWNHKRLHLDQRPFRCEFCSCAFKWKNSLKSHLDSHKKSNKRLKISDQTTKVSYADAVRRGSETPLFKYRNKNEIEIGNENEKNQAREPPDEVQAAISSILEELPSKVDLLDEGENGENIDPHTSNQPTMPMVVPRNLQARDLLRFESEAEQQEFEKLFAEGNGTLPPPPPLQPLIECEVNMSANITTETKMEISNYEDISFEVIACGIEPLSASDLATVANRNGIVSNNVGGGDIDGFAGQLIRIPEQSDFGRTITFTTPITVANVACEIICETGSTINDQYEIESDDAVRVVPAKMW